MLKLNSEALEQKGEVYYHQGSLFDGYAVDKHECSISFYDNGRPRRARCEELLSAPPPGTHIDTESLESRDGDDEEPYYLNNEPFTGVAYIFNGIYLDGIQYIKEGVITKEISWYKSGNTATLESNSNNLRQEYWWNDDGTPRKVDITAPTKNQFNLEFSTNGQLQGITITEGAVETIDKNRGELLYPELSSADNIIKFPVSQHITLYGKGISDTLLTEIFAFWKTEKIYSISILNTKATFDSLKNLQHFSELKEIKLTQDHSCSDDVASLLYSRLNGCSVSIG